MRNRILPLALASALALGSAAFASGVATTIMGTVKAIDTAQMTFTLADGSIYKLPQGFSASDLHVGEKVTVTWISDNGTKEATKILAQ